MEKEKKKRYPSPMTIRESFIQARVINALEMNGDYVIRMRSTNKDGIPDLLVIPKDKEKRPYFIEVKANYGKVRPMQHFRAKELKKYDIETKYIIDWRKGPIEKVFTDSEIEHVINLDLDYILDKERIGRHGGPKNADIW